MDLSPSVNATAPASSSSPISVITSPPRCLVSAAIGTTRTLAVAAARRLMKSTSEGSSITGSVLGMTTMVVTPPAAAARLADSSVSRCSLPGSPVNTRMSIRPGESTSPLQSITSGSFASASLKRRGPTSAILPFSINRPPRASRLLAGSIRRALRKASRFVMARSSLRAEGRAPAHPAPPCEWRRPFPPVPGSRSLQCRRRLRSRSPRPGSSGRDA